MEGSAIYQIATRIPSKRRATLRQNGIAHEYKNNHTNKSMKKKGGSSSLLSKRFAERNRARKAKTSLHGCHASGGRDKRFASFQQFDNIVIIRSDDVSES
jgi:hypothetical protein